MRDNEYFDEIKTGGRPKMVINKRGLGLVKQFSVIGVGQHIDAYAEGGGYLLVAAHYFRQVGD